MMDKEIKLPICPFCNTEMELIGGRDGDHNWVYSWVCDCMYKSEQEIRKLANIIQQIIREKK